MYNDLVCRGMYEASARVYMLHLVGCTILAGKSRVYIDAKYIWLLNSLEHCSSACGCVSLTVLYVALEKATVFLDQTSCRLYDSI